MKVDFLPGTDEEFREAAWYFACAVAGVGLSFIAALHKAVDEIVAVADQRKRPNYWHVRLKSRSSGG